MKCPKCGKELAAGALGPGGKGSLFWANNDFFKDRVCNFFTEGQALKKGAIHIPVGDGVIHGRTKAWACEDCKYVVIDCN